MSILNQSVQSLSRAQLSATPWTAATPGLPVPHQLPELAQTHVHQVGDAIQPSHPLSSHVFCSGQPYVKCSVPPFLKILGRRCFLIWGPSSPRLAGCMLELGEMVLTSVNASRLFPVPRVRGKQGTRTVYFNIITAPDPVKPG